MGRERHTWAANAMHRDTRLPDWASRVVIMANLQWVMKALRSRILLSEDTSVSRLASLYGSACFVCWAMLALRCRPVGVWFISSLWNSRLENMLITSVVEELLNMYPRILVLQWSPGMM